jgi:hypothetical protein
VSRTLSELLNAIPDEKGRSELLDLGRRAHDTMGPAARTAENAEERQRLLEAIAERIRWHFRAARYAVPDVDELQQMIDDHFR